MVSHKESDDDEPKLTLAMHDLIEKRVEKIAGAEMKLIDKQIKFALGLVKVFSFVFPIIAGILVWLGYGSRKDMEDNNQRNIESVTAEMQAEVRKRLEVEFSEPNIKASINASAIEQTTKSVNSFVAQEVKARIVPLQTALTLQVDEANHNIQTMQSFSSIINDLYQTKSGDYRAYRLLVDSSKSTNTQTRDYALHVLNDLSEDMTVQPPEGIIQLHKFTIGGKPAYLEKAPLIEQALVFVLQTHLDQQARQSFANFFMTIVTDSDTREVLLPFLIAKMAMKNDPCGALLSQQIILCHWQDPFPQSMDIKDYLKSCLESKTLLSEQQRHYCDEIIQMCADGRISDDEYDKLNSTSTTLLRTR